MVDYLGIYKVAKALMQDISKAYKKKNIGDLIPYFEDLRKDGEITHVQQRNLERLIKDFIDEIIKFCKQILKVPNFEILSHCLGYIPVKGGDDYLKEDLKEKDLEGLKEHLVDNLELEGEIDLMKYMKIWNETGYKDREKALDILGNLYLTEIKSTAKKINDIYDIDEILNNWSLYNKYPDFELVISFLLLGV
jgi:hypothetical protein